MHKAFEVHILNEEGIERARGLASAFDQHLEFIRLSVGITQHSIHPNTYAKCVEHLELASFYAKKTLANDSRWQSSGGVGHATPDRIDTANMGAGASWSKAGTELSRPFWHQAIDGIPTRDLEEYIAGRKR